ncbi:transposase [Pseudonocardia sp. NPDC046786]|uniref:transposase n=1 Tax=Pseudonocardia sp. NPDC046786 TaxID=3155471 RepID=UPI0033CD2253
MRRWCLVSVLVVRRVVGTWRGHRLILFGFLPRSSKAKGGGRVLGVAHGGAIGGRDTPQDCGDPAGHLAGFRRRFYAALTARADALFELTDAVLCSDGPVTSLVELTLVAEHRRGHGALYDALAAGQVEPAQLRRSLTGLTMPQVGDRIVLAVDVSPWLRPDAATSSDRLLALSDGRLWHRCGGVTARHVRVTCSVL